MTFEAGKGNLRDIHKLMTQIDELNSGISSSMHDRNSIIKGHIIRIANQPQLLKTYSEKTSYSLFNIEHNLNQLRSEIDTYKHKLLLSKIFFLEFQELRATFIK